MSHWHRSICFAVLLSSVTAAHAAPPKVDASRVPTGILHDLTASFAHIERFDGSASAPAANAATLRQAVFELERASLEPRAWPSSRVLRDDGRLVVRIALLDARYDRVRDEAIRSGAARVEGDALALEPGATETRRAFMAAALRDYTYRGSDVTFVLDSRAFAGDARPARVEVDFDDGAGFRELEWDRQVGVHYGFDGERVVRVRAIDASGAVQQAAFGFEVRALVTPAPNDTIPLTGVAP
jgi:hypothetical protein